MIMTANEVKYLVSVSVPVNWFPGERIEQFEIVVNKRKKIDLLFLQKQAEEKGYNKFKVIGTVLVAEGKKKSTKKPELKEDNPVK